CPKLLSEQPSNRSRAPRQWGHPGDDDAVAATEPRPEPVVEAPEEAPRPRRSAPRCDPGLIAAARELRDRWLEAVERDPSLLLPEPKYDLARRLTAEARRDVASVRLLEEAA